MTAELPPIERLRAIRLEPGETLVVTLADDFDYDEGLVDTWRLIFRQALGDHPVIFVQGEFEFSVIESASVG